VAFTHITETLAIGRKGDGAVDILDEQLRRSAQHRSAIKRRQSMLGLVLSHAVDVAAIRRKGKTGDMYAMVPTAVPGLVSKCAVSPIVSPPRFSSPSRNSLARPKSRILMAPRSVTKMLAGLMSRCTMPFCARHRARQRAVCLFPERVESARGRALPLCRATGPPAAPWR
jgi:hypothetical protein